MSDNEGVIYEEDGDLQDEGSTEIEYLESEIQVITPKKDEHPRRRYALRERPKKKQRQDESLYIEKKNRFIPIRPKPYPALIIKQQTNEDSPATSSVPTVLPNHIIVTIPNKETIPNKAHQYLLSNKDKQQYIFPPGVNVNKMDNNAKLNGDAANATAKVKSQANEKAVKKLSNPASNKVPHNVKASPVPTKDSIELFFESMAQSVLNLPQKVQANIKMKICQIVTMAEIKYSQSETKSRTT